MGASNEINELAAALVLAQGEFDTVSKDSNNPFFKSKYAGLPEVMKTASPVLAKHGLAVSQFLSTNEQGDTLTTWLIHKSGQYINDTMRLILPEPYTDERGKFHSPTPQDQGSATTYARRYSYMAVLGLVADEDDDGNAASKPKPAYPSRKPADQAKPAEIDATAQTAGPEGDPLGLNEPKLTTEQVTELMQLAKKKGHTTKEAAVAFLNKEAMLPDFRELFASEFETFKKQVISAGWKR